MKRINTAERLDEALRVGNVSDPEMKGLVNTARQLESLQSVTPMSPGELGAARRVFLAEAQRMRGEAHESTWLERVKRALRPLAPRRPFVPAPVLVAFLLVLSFLLGLGGFNRAAQQALPGQRLYRVKLASEDFRSTFTIDHYKRVTFYLDIASRRNDEISRLAQAKQPIPDEIVFAFENSLRAALFSASQLPDIGLQAALAEIVKVSSGAGEYLAHASTWVDDDISRMSLNQAAVYAYNTSNYASMGMNDPNMFRMNMGAPNIHDDPTPTSTSGVVYLPNDPTPIVMQPTATQVMMMPPAVQPSPTATLSSQVPVSASKTPTEGIPSQPPTKTEAAPVLPTPTAIILPPTQVAPTLTPTATPTPSEPLQPPTPTLIQQGVEN